MPGYRYTPRHHDVYYQLRPPRTGMMIEILLALTLLLMLFTWLGVRWLEWRHPPTGTMLDADRNARLHFTVTGERNASNGTLVLLHGASSNLLEFASSIGPMLAEHYRVVAVDRPGLGYSTRHTADWPTPEDQAREIQKLIRHLSIDAPVLVGHSWAGALVMSHLLAFPGMARAAVLIAPATHSWHSPPALYNRISRLPVIGWLFRWTLVLPLGSLVLGQGMKTVFYRGKVPDRYRTQAGVDLVLRPQSWLANADDLCLLNAFLAAQESRYGEVQVPVLAITGAEDQVVLNAIHIGGLSRTLSDFQVIEMAETGHSPHQSHPQRTVEAIREFVVQCHSGQVRPERGPGSSPG